ncbi:MAG: tripartite tricarboxylate transporter substrate binding protein [Betaproteobacteria bacterium]|nr:tripartite tricarboxylate transporter substrate binding protein [Betaproteobacteria bacterium]
MKIPIRWLVVLVAALHFFPFTALSQTFPSKPVRIVVPYPPGGGVDSVARPLSDWLGRLWGHAAVLEYKPGGASIIGAEIVVRSAPDGYTLLLTSDSTVTSHPHLYSKLPYDPMKDLAPVTQLVGVPLMVVAHVSVSANSLEELAAFGRANPGALNYSSIGNGSQAQLMFESLAAQSGARFTQIPYKGNAAALQAIIAGEVQFGIAPTVFSRGYIQAGKLKLLAISRSEREPLMAQVPTVGEAGFPNMDSRAWFGVLAPRGTPAAILTKIQSDMASILSNPEYRERYLVKSGYDTVASSPEQFAAFLRSDLEHKAQMIKAAGIRQE